MFENLEYWDALKLYQDTEWDENHAAVIIHNDEHGRYTLQTLDEGKSFHLCYFEFGKHLGKIVRKIKCPPEVEFIFTLRHDWPVGEEDE